MHSGSRTEGGAARVVGGFVGAVALISVVACSERSQLEPKGVDTTAVGSPPPQATYSPSLDPQDDPRRPALEEGPSGGVEEERSKPTEKLETGESGNQVQAAPPPDPRATDGFTGRGDASKRPLVFQAVASELEGKIAQDDVGKALDEAATTLTACISTSTSATIRLKVLPSGKVADAKVPRSVPNDAKVRDCLASALKSLNFPRLKGLEPATFSLDLTLKKG